MAQCTGTSKQSGERCKRHAIPGMNVCKHHGGLSPKGIASPNLKHGRHSKYMPKGMLDKYGAFLSDPDTLSLFSEIALADARISELLERAGNSEGAGKLWSQLVVTLAELDAAIAEKKSKDMLIALSRLRDIVGKGQADYMRWEEIMSLVEKRRRLVESERKRAVEMQQSLDVSRVMLFVQAILMSIKTHVKDQKTLDRISRDIAQLTNGNSMG